MQFSCSFVLVTHVDGDSCRRHALSIHCIRQDVFQDELIGYVLVKIWDVLHLVRDDPEIITMGLDGDLLRISLAYACACKRLLCIVVFT